MSAAVASEIVTNSNFTDPVYEGSSSTQWRAEWRGADWVEAPDNIIQSKLAISQPAAMSILKFDCNGSPTLSLSCPSCTFWKATLRPLLNVMKARNYIFMFNFVKSFLVVYKTFEYLSLNFYIFFNQNPLQLWGYPYQGVSPWVTTSLCTPLILRHAVWKQVFLQWRGCRRVQKAIANYRANYCLENAHLQ